MTNLHTLRVTAAASKFKFIDLKRRDVLQLFPNTEPGLAGETGVSGACGTVY
jgi:hypothetical protein